MEALKILDIEGVAIRFVNPDLIINFVFSDKIPVELDEQSLKQRYESLFSHLKLFSRILFVDETFHSGRGLLTLRTT